MKRKPVVGEKLFSLNIGNAARDRDQTLTPVMVTKVGTKYFSVKEVGREDSYFETRFKIENWEENTQFPKTQKLYESAEEFENEKLEYNICRDLHEAFEYGNNKYNVDLNVLILFRNHLLRFKDDYVIPM